MFIYIFKYTKNLFSSSRFIAFILPASALQPPIVNFPPTPPHMLKQDSIFVNEGLNNYSHQPNVSHVIDSRISCNKHVKYSFNKEFIISRNIRKLQNRSQLLKSLHLQARHKSLLFALSYNVVSKNKIKRQICFSPIREFFALSCCCLFFPLQVSISTECFSLFKKSTRVTQFSFFLLSTKRA